MCNKFVCLALSVLLLTLCFSAEAQQPGKIPWIGYLAATGSGPSPAFIQGLRDLGYVEGKNIAIVFRTAGGKSERISDLAAELVRLKVDLIVTDNTSAALGLKKATGTIPIVMTTSTDPVGSGLITSFAARRERHRTDVRCRGNRWQIFGATEGDRPETQSCGHSKG